MFSLSASPPDPGELAGSLANGAGSQLLAAVVDVLPALVPILVAFWAVGFVWRKVTGGMSPNLGGVGGSAKADKDPHAGMWSDSDRSARAAGGREWRTDKWGNKVSGGGANGGWG